MVLTIWREGDVCHADWTGTADQAPGSINFHIHEGLCKLFLGIYMIMAFDPQILFNDGLYDVFEVTLPEGSLLNPKFPAPLSNRLNVHTRLLRLPERRARPEGARSFRWPPATAPARCSCSPGRPGRRVLPVRRAAVRRAPRPVPSATGSTGTPGGRCSARRRPNTPRAYYPVMIERYIPVRDYGRRRVFTAAAPGSRRSTSSRVAEHSPSTTTARRSPRGVSTAGGHGGRSTKTLIRADGERVELPSKLDHVHGEAGDPLVFRTAGAGGWGDPLDATRRLVLSDVQRDLVSSEAALREYGVVINGDAVDEAATQVQRDRCREQRGPVEPFDFGHAPTG